MNGASQAVFTSDSVTDLLTMLQGEVQSFPGLFAITNPQAPLLEGCLACIPWALLILKETTFFHFLASDMEMHGTIFFIGSGKLFVYSFWYRRLLFWEGEDFFWGSIPPHSIWIVALDILLLGCENFSNYYT